LALRNVNIKTVSKAAADAQSDVAKKIRRAALKVFSDKGYGRANIPDIAAEAGVSVGTIYNHYKNKDALRHAVVSHYQQVPLISKQLERPLDKDLKAFLGSLYDTMLNLNVRWAGYAIFLFDEIKRDPGFRRDYIKEVIVPFRRQVGASLKTAMKQGCIAKMDPSLVASLMGALFLGVTLVYVIEQDKSPLNKVPRDELINMLVDLTLSGLEGNRSSGE